MSQEIERPKSSHGRPRTGYRNRQVQQHVITEPAPRPTSSRRGHITHENRQTGYYDAHNQDQVNAKHVDPYAQNKGLGHTSQPFYVPLKDESDCVPLERPKSSRGRSRESRDYSASIEDDVPQGRPKSSRGRRLNREDTFYNDPTDLGVQSPSPTRKARPKSAKGRARSANRGHPPAHYGDEGHLLAQRMQEVNVLTLDDDSSTSYASYGQTSHHQQHNMGHNMGQASPASDVYSHTNNQHHYGDYQHAHLDNHSHGQQMSSPFGSPRIFSPQHNDRPGTGMARPMSGRSSARPQTPAERAMLNEGLTKDNDFLRSDTPLSARPDSASSFSKFKILPSIGLRTPQRAQPQPSLAPAPLSQSHQEPQIREPMARYREPIKRESIDMGNALTPRSVAPNTIQNSPALNSTNVAEVPANQQAEVGGLAPIKIPTPEEERDITKNNEDVNTAKKDTTGKIEGAEENETEPFFPELKREIKLPEEAKAGNDSIQLAIKLPNGDRVKRYFLKSNTLEVVVNFAEVSSQLDFTGTEIVCDAPRKIFTDLNQNIGNTGLLDRTVLHIQYPDLDT